ncbi:hypothetical protein SAMN02745229_01902 [Butyrivibrio fibrisolvens DSM 3071]|uniref:Uncharacterized protein n=1 Tax=Butyrivibrio fibrisolvens DSM 3071 TaxID=1121131 RepID=A0A1M5Z275_BUTFI|nr:hypothetical protein [Butyrivibrio fibrisolvens]SHI18281.1 hypothetical protein SAMN02745229_01902 [Butyrivibrio fibrisolvens DSM 3071]
MKKKKEIIICAIAIIVLFLLLFFFHKYEYKKGNWYLIDSNGNFISNIFYKDKEEK